MPFHNPVLPNNLFIREKWEAIVAFESDYLLFLWEGIESCEW